MNKADQVTTNDPVEYALAKHTKERKQDMLGRRAESELLRKHLVPVVRTFGAAFADCGWTEDKIAITISSSGYWSNWIDPPGARADVMVSVAVDVAAWRDLTPVFEALDENGFAPVEKWINEDDAASYTRVYSQRLVKTRLDEVEIRILAHLPGDTDTCRRVLVGYDTPYVSQPTPKYKMICDGGQDAPPLV